MLRLHPFRYHRPQQLDDAVALLSEHGPAAMPIAGGTDLMPNMKLAFTLSCNLHPSIVQLSQVCLHVAVSLNFEL